MNIGFGELIILAVVAFVLFGPKAFLRNMRRLGVYWGRLQSTLSNFTNGEKVGRGVLATPESRDATPHHNPDVVDVVEVVDVEKNS